jgi:hypothetical protein
MTEELVKREDPYLDLIREVTANPELSAEKLKILVDMRVQLEDREAEREFDSALLSAQDEIEAIAWDKKGEKKGDKESLYVSYPKMEKTIRPIRKKHGFTQSWDSEPGTTPEIVMLCCDLIHKGGHRRRYRTPMPIDGQGPKGGGVMTKNQAVNAGTSYGMRNLEKMIWNIPVLVDKDDRDGATVYETITESQVADLRALADECKIGKETAADCLKAMADYFKVDGVENLPKSSFQSAVTGMRKRKQSK